MSIPNPNIEHIFFVNFEISDAIFQGTSLNLSLIVDTDDAEIVGTGHVLQDPTSVLDIKCHVKGKYFIQKDNVTITIEGRSPSVPIVDGKPSPIRNLILKMVLDENLGTGTATYAYLDNENWCDPGFQSVDVITNNHQEISDLKELSSRLMNQATMRKVLRNM